MFGNANFHELKPRRKAARDIVRVAQGGALVCLALSLCACKTWYKQGADADELEIEQRHCETLTGADAGDAFIECMTRAGWNYTTMSATSVKPDDGDDDTEAFNGGQAPNTHESSPAPGANAVATEQPEARREAASDSRTPNAGPGADRPVSGGWFQLGMDADDLKQDQTACKATGATTIERCLRKRGWQPVDVRMSTE